jgi:hypothetical protein
LIVATPATTGSAKSAQRSPAGPQGGHRDRRGERVGGREHHRYR